MNRLSQFYKKYLAALFNTRAAAVYMLLFAGSIAVATFLENDYGTASAQKLVYKSTWFEVLLWLFSLTIIANIVKFRMLQQKKWALVLFHSAIIIILIGAGITRYLGYEGIMRIREGSSSNTFISSESYLKFRVDKQDRTYGFDESVLFATLGNNNWKQKYLIDSELIDIRVTEFIPNPVQEIIESDHGNPILKIVVPGRNGREEHFLSGGEIKSLGGTLFNFQDTVISGGFNIKYENDSLWFRSDDDLTQMTMATQTLDTIVGSSSELAWSPLAMRSLYSDGSSNFVFSEFYKKAEQITKSASSKETSESVKAVRLNISVNGTSQDLLLYESKGFVGNPKSLSFNNFNISASYGPKEIKLPFSIKLNKFILEKYSGTNTPSSYASEVQLIDTKNNVAQDYKIYMNHILNYKGYRFFQSSFDQDEKGTYLSVNHDYWGTLITYIGYALLTLGMLLVFFSKKTRFNVLRQKLKKVREANSTYFLLFFILFSTPVLKAQGQNSNSDTIPIHINEEHAAKFSHLLVQDYQGRVKPVHTMTRELLRKITKKQSWSGMNADQVILSLFANNEHWYDVKMIKLGKHQKIHKILEVSGKYASYSDFFDDEGSYKLQKESKEAFSTKPIDRGTFEKELLKLDEKVNIVQMMFTGSFLRLIPDDENTEKGWFANDVHSNNGNLLASKFFGAYNQGLQSALKTGDYSVVNKLLDELGKYQLKYGGETIPSAKKVNAEVFLNNSKIFNRLSLVYLLLGLIFLFSLFLSVFKPNLELKKLYIVLISLVFVAFGFHTLGLGLRWYVSGRAPWSNGYESMIYIGWTSTLAGLIFARRSFGGIAATMVLASTILLVSTLSFLDPEITPLVPVLKSYWLTIHVSLEAGSYGFLMLGALIGIINLILMMFLRPSNKTRVKAILKEMTYISEMTLIAGLFLVSVGTYLGGVWANESWGRYWGWDAKETWALITILVYAFILHMRLIPKMNGLFTYNVATIFGLGSVIMTYYGVNYYLSGLHSYATGDPVPIPSWVYIFVACIIVISAVAYIKKKKYKLS
jgi:cytochrome c-type biogenesis protein CcsB